MTRTAKVLLSLAILGLVALLASAPNPRVCRRMGHTRDDSYVFRMM